MCLTRDHQLLRSHRSQGTSFSRIARENRHVAVYPVTCVRRVAYLSDTLRYRRHEVERRRMAIHNLDNDYHRTHPPDPKVRPGRLAHFAEHRTLIKFNQDLLAFGNRKIRRLTRRVA